MPRTFPRSAALVGAMLLAVSVAGCGGTPARTVTQSKPTGVSVPVSAPEFCTLAQRALPDQWDLDQIAADPYRTGATAPSVTCSLGTGHEVDPHTTVLVTWKPDATAEESTASLAHECDLVRRVATGSGVSPEENSDWCQGVDAANTSKVSQWTLLAFTSEARPGVLVIRVDTTDPRYGRTLAGDTRRFAADLTDVLPG